MRWLGPGLLTLVAAISVLSGCGSVQPVRAKVVDCQSRAPLADVQFERMGTITRSQSDGSWESEMVGKGTYPAHVFHAGYRDERLQLTPGEAGQTICLQPTAK